MFNNFINNLSLRFKLILFLIIPILTLLYFSSSSIYLKFNEYQEGKKSLDSILISFQIDDVLHELQMERGISEGFLASGGKFQREKLLLQRQLVDNKVRHLFSSLEEQNRNKKHSELIEVISRAELNKQKLAAIRKNIDAMNNNGFFEDYSDLISNGLNLIRDIQIVTSNSIHARQRDSYINLLLLQERAGQERGLLNGVFASGKIDANKFNLITGYNLEQKALFKEFYSVASKEQQTLLRVKMQHQIVSDVEKLRAAAIHKASKNDLLNSLQSFIGYGGLIHSFKNYVIRGNKKYKDRVNTVYAEAIKVIMEYQELPGISDKEINSLNIIKNTFDKYKSFLEAATYLKNKGKTIKEIDFIVKVDDRPALEAINYLHKTVTGLETGDWWDKASFRINLIREVSNSIRINIIELAQKNLSSAKQSLFLNFILTIVSLLISFILAYQFIRYLIGSIINIVTHISKMQEKNEFDKLLKVNSRDEIGKLAEEFNNLIKEHGKFEEQLQLAATVFNKASEAMVITDADNQFVMVNPAFTNITGYSSADVVGKTPALLNSGKQGKSFYKDMWSSLRAKGNWSGEILNRRKNGEIFPEWLNINSIKDNQGKIVRYIAMFSDITERKQNEDKQAHLQRQLMQSQKMDSLGQLTGGIAHDFNNMLSAILGYTELAMELEDDKETVKSYLNEVLLAGNRAKELIARMLSFSRGGHEIELQQLNIEPLLNDTVKMIRPLLPSTIEFETNITTSQVPIFINPVMIHQVIMNICINARDAIVDHGKITFKSKLISLENEICSSCHVPISGDFIEVSINDTGSGISSKNMEHLFEPFFSTKEMGSEKGTGMGLAMVHGIIHDHNGHIIVESTEGKGSTFRLLFPYIIEKDKFLGKDNKKAEHVSVAESDPASIIKGRHILLIDDEEAITTMIQTVLETYGCQVTTFVDSQFALLHFKENKEQYDLVITDQTMPKITGAELSKEILDIRPDIPIIMCTGHSEKVNKVDAKTMGIKAYMPKPIRNKELIKTIAELLSH